MKCSVVIPTYNRPAYLKRILSYYHQYGSGLPIIIADSSSEENNKRNRETIDSFNDSCFSYIDKYDTSTSAFHKILDALQQVSTEYCVLCADDDFVTPNGIKQSVDFLEHNPDFTVAHGRYIRFMLGGGGSGTGKIFSWFNYGLPPEIKPSSKPASTLSHINMGPSITFPGAVERLHYHLSNYYIPTVYAVHKTDFIKMVWVETQNNTCDGHFGELLPSMLTLIHGKMKCLDVFYGARDASTARAVYWRPLNDYSTAEYNEEYTKFKGCLAMHLSAESGLDTEASGKVIDDAMAAYMKNHYYGHKRRVLINSINGVLINNINYILHHLPDWMDKVIRILYRKLLSSGRTNTSSEYCDDLYKIRLHVLLHDGSQSSSKDHLKLKWKWTKGND